MLTAVVTYGSNGPEVLSASEGEEGYSSTCADCSIIPRAKILQKDRIAGEVRSGPSRSCPKPKSCTGVPVHSSLFALLMRFFCSAPSSEHGSRYDSIRGAHAEADQARSEAS